MNAKRLLKLADFLSQLPPQKFYFGVIAREGDRSMLEALAARKEDCGTVACAIGWTPAVFPRLVRWKHGNFHGLEVALKAKPRCVDFSMAEKVFGISGSDADYLFDPNDSDLGSMASAKRVAQHIRRFVKRGGGRPRGYVA